MCYCCYIVTAVILKLFAALHLPHPETYFIVFSARSGRHKHIQISYYKNVTGISSADCSAR
jgi:hypothetical protein